MTSVRSTSHSASPASMSSIVPVEQEGPDQGDHAPASPCAETPHTSKDQEGYCLGNGFVQRNNASLYRYTCLAIWLISSMMIVLDRFYWNVWPRQTICSPGCGGDFFCDMDEDPGCLKAGPMSVKIFDAVARISARLVISTTNLLFITMCHGTWNYLSEVHCLRSFLYAWRDDNFWLHGIGGWTIGIWIIAHVWSLILPSIFDGYTNRMQGGPVELPLQVGLYTSNVSVEDKEAVWGYDDVWRIVWMTIIFGFLLPLSRSAWALRKNFSLAMWLHMALGFGVFFDSWRRKTHPHVWILNTPVFLWYVADKLWCYNGGRVDPHARATRVILDSEYMLLLWKNDDQPKRICDIFWLKHSDRAAGDTARTGEMAHPFTTCSSHDVTAEKRKHASFLTRREVRSTIEIPAREADSSWWGHRFFLTNAMSGAWNELGSARQSRRYKTSTSSDNLGQWPTPQSQPKVRENTARMSRRGSEEGSAVEGAWAHSANSQSSRPSRLGQELPQSSRLNYLKSKNGSGSFVDLAGVEEGHPSESRLAIDDTVDALRISGKAYSTHGGVEGGKMNGSNVAGWSEDSTSAVHAKKKQLLQRLDTRDFEDCRKRQAENGTANAVLSGTWSKMAIMRIHRRKDPTVRECACLGLTWALSIVRRTETANIADKEQAEKNNSVNIRTSGPYRSEYGRLGQFPNLPPLLIIATGAGAALALDFIGYVRANKLVPARPVSVFYSSASLALLQFVTNTLLAEKTPGIHIKTALTRHDDLEVVETDVKGEEELTIGRLDVESIVEDAVADSEVYFCGGGGINALLRKTCAKRKMYYAGSSVQ